mgnify:CR=1 FL=1
MVSEPNVWNFLWTHDDITEMELEDLKRRLMSMLFWRAYKYFILYYSNIFSIFHNVFFLTRQRKLFKHNIFSLLFATLYDNIHHFLPTPRVRYH